MQQRLDMTCQAGNLKWTCQEGTRDVKVEDELAAACYMHIFECLCLTSCFLGAAGAVEVIKPAERESRASSVLSGF